MGLAQAETLLVLNKSEATVTLIDVATRRQVDTLPTGCGPHEIALSPDGRQAAITNYGEDIAGNSLTLIDLASRTVSSTIDLGLYTRPHGIVWIPGTSQVLVTCEDQRVVLRVDILQQNILAVISTAQKASHMVAVSPDAKRAYVANISPGTVSVLDLVNNRRLAVVETGKGTEGIEVSADGQTVWTTNRSEDSLSRLNREGDLSGPNLKLFSGSFPIRVKFVPASDMALVTNAKSDSLQVFHSGSGELRKTIPFPKHPIDSGGKMSQMFPGSSAPIGIAVAPAARQAFVAHGNSDRITIIDLSTLQISGELQAGREPDGMAVSPFSY